MCQCNEQTTTRRTTNEQCLGHANHHLPVRDQQQYQQAMQCDAMHDCSAQRTYSGAVAASRSIPGCGGARIGDTADAVNPQSPCVSGSPNHWQPIHGAKQSSYSSIPPMMSATMSFTAFISTASVRSRKYPFPQVQHSVRSSLFTASSTFKFLHQSLSFCSPAAPSLRHHAMTSPSVDSLFAAWQHQPRRTM
jgi:hypothetical protein